MRMQGEGAQPVVQMYLALAAVQGQEAWAWGGVLSWRGHLKLFSGSAVGSETRLLLWAAEQGAGLLKRPSRVEIFTDCDCGLKAQLPTALLEHGVSWSPAAAGHPLAAQALAEAEFIAEALSPAWRIFQAPPAAPPKPQPTRPAVGQDWLCFGAPRRN